MSRWLRALFTPDGVVPALPEPGMVTLHAGDVTVRRGGRAVLAGASCDVVAGRLTALVGPNGAGKSSLLSALAGEIATASGIITLDGRPLSDWTLLAMARRRAVLPQTHAVGFPFTAREVVSMGRAPWARTRRSANDEPAVDAALAATDAEAFAARPFTELSGGERARVALARVLAQDTATLLLDEPTAALDLGHQEQVMRLAKARAAAGHAVVVVLHDLNLAAAYADTVVVLADGRIVETGAPATVFTPGLLSGVYQYPVDIIEHPETGARFIQARRE